MPVNYTPSPLTACARHTGNTVGEGGGESLIPDLGDKEGRMLEVPAWKHLRWGDESEEKLCWMNPCLAPSRGFLQVLGAFLKDLAIWPLLRLLFHTLIPSYSLVFLRLFPLSALLRSQRFCHTTLGVAAVGSVTLKARGSVEKCRHGLSSCKFSGGKEQLPLVRLQPGSEHPLSPGPPPLPLACLC